MIIDINTNITLSQGIFKESKIEEGFVRSQVNNCRRYPDSRKNNFEQELGKDNEPFVNNHTFSKWEQIKLVLIGAVLVPIRLPLYIVIVICMWLTSMIALFGLTAEEKAVPLRGWRKNLQKLVMYEGRVMCFIIGFMVQIKGRCSSDAPIIVIAPHTTFFDGQVMFWLTSFPTVLSRAQDKNAPIIGKIEAVFQPIYVTREDHDSRKKTVEMINKRCNQFMCLNKKDRPSPVAMFPEATTTNGKWLIKFKKGAFIPGLPVQPTVIKYPNSLDTVTSTGFKSKSILTILFATIATPYTNVVIEFLPPYIPSEKEKPNPEYFATNVRSYIANKTGIPTSNVTFNNQ